MESRRRGETVARRRAVAHALLRRRYNAPVSEAPFPVEPARVRHPRRGYAMALVASLLWGVNGTGSKVTMVGAFSSLQLVELRSLGAFAVLAAALLVLAPQTLRVTRRELPALVA